MNIFFISLGCDKNRVDSETMLGLLYEKGHTVTDDESEADVIVVNSCCFIGDAKEESINTIIEMAEYKETGMCKALVVTGCLAQRYAKEIREELPEVDAIVGTTAYEYIADIIEEAVAGKMPQKLEDINYLPTVHAKRIVTTGGYYSYLKIAEGCDKCCTYCVIPKVRGSYRSVPMEQLIKQAKELVEGGVRELMLVAQETTLYGVDLYGKKSLPELLRKLSEIEDLHWIRILYCYPEEIDEELIDTIAALPKVCNYLDIPIQHASDTVLKRMGRRTTQAELIEKIEMIRRKIPDITLRTTLICGFPGETEQDHEELLSFVEKMQFDHLGAFTYSREEDTPADLLEGHMEEEEKERRRDEVMQLQQEISFARADKLCGRKLEVMIEGRLPEDDVYIGRTCMDAPDIDGYIFMDADRMRMSGDFVMAEVVQANGYDLIGVIVENEFTE